MKDELIDNLLSPVKNDKKNQYSNIVMSINWKKSSPSD